jgi:hypothetical protein
VAQALMTQRGFPDNGKGTLPWVLAQVMGSWRAHGGDNAPPPLKKRLAREGNNFVISVLKHFGTARHAFIAAKNPGARDYDRQAPLEAIERFEGHMNKVRGTTRLAGYVDYFKGSDGENSDDDAERKRQADKKRKRGDKVADRHVATAAGRDKKGGAGGAGADAKTSIKVDMKHGLVHGML